MKLPAASKNNKRATLFSPGFIGRYTIDRELKKFAKKYDGKNRYCETFAKYTSFTQL